MNVGVPSFKKHNVKNKQRSVTHCIERATEHYGLDLSADDILSIEDDIKLGLTTIVRRAGAETASTVHRVSWRGNNIYVVYSNRFNKLMTILPKRWATTHSNNYLGDR